MQLDNEKTLEELRENKILEDETVFKLLESLKDDYKFFDEFGYIYFCENRIIEEKKQLEKLIKNKIILDKKVSFENDYCIYRLYKKCEYIYDYDLKEKLMYLFGGAIVLFNLGAFGLNHIESKKIKKMMIPGNLIELKIPKKLTLKEKENLIYNVITKGPQSILALMYYSNIINKLQEELNNGDLEAKQQLEEWESLLK